MMFDFGMNLIQLRKEYKLTQKQLARLLDVSVNTIFNWENNYVLPNLNSLISLSNLYGVSLNYLIGMDKERVITLNGLTGCQRELLQNVYSAFCGGSQQECEKTERLLESIWGCDGLSARIKL